MNRALMGCGQGNSGCTVFSVGWKCSPGRKKPLQTPARQWTSPVSLLLLAAHWAVLSILSITRMNTNGDA